MFNIGFFKGQPTDYILCYTSGAVSAEGPGLAFFYLKYRTQIVAVPTSSLEASFVFNETTRDFQDVTLQGQITYRVTDAKLAASQLNFRIDPATYAYVSEDPEKLARRVTNLVQVETRAELAGRTLEESLRDAPAIAASVAEKLRNGRQLAPLGVEVQDVIFLSARPTPEVGKALEAEYRESLLRKADEAVYARRAAAVEEERKIKEKELATDVTLEQQREQLIVLQGANALKEAENRGVALEREAQSKAKAAELELAVFRTMPPREMLAYAMKEIGANAGQIGNLTVTTELLASLLNKEQPAVAFDKVVVVTRKTALEELVERFNTRNQARFYIEHLGQSFADYQSAHDTYHAALKRLKGLLPDGVRAQFVERSFLPNFLFGPENLVVAVGPDGLVVNTAKYLDGQPLVGVNPDPERIDGILVPFTLDSVKFAFANLLAGGQPIEPVTMAEARLSDGQTLLAVNDLFIGQRTHVSARYVLTYDGMRETQSSSGIIVSTGAGSTGWLRSILAGAAGIVEGRFGGDESARALREDYRFAPGSDELRFHVREPFASRSSQAELVCGVLGPGDVLEVVSQMPQNGVIFSDGVESDYLRFDSGTTATIGIADRKLKLAVPPGYTHDQ